MLPMQCSYSRKQLIEAASLTENDLQEVSRCRGAHNRLGFGYQLGFVRLFNRFPTQQPFEVTDEIVTFVGVQLGIDRALIADYSNHRDAISDHQIRIRDYLKLRGLGEVEIHNLEAFLFEEACRLEHTAALQARVQDYLKAQRILLPAESTLIRIIGEQRQRAREVIYERITAVLPGKLAGVLDELLQVPLGEKASPLQRIKANPRNPSPEAMLVLLQKLQLIETTGILQVDLSWLSGNYQRALFHYVNQCSVDRLREVVQPRRNAALVCFLWQSYRDAVDQAVDMYDKLITWVHTQAEADLDEQLRQQRKTLQSSLASFKSLGTIVLDDTVPDIDLRIRLFDQIPRDELATQMEALDEWITGKKSDAFHGVISRFSYLRQFAPAFLRALDFKPEAEGPNPCLEALAVIKALIISADDSTTPLIAFSKRLPVTATPPPTSAAGISPPIRAKSSTH